MTERNTRKELFFAVAMTVLSALLTIQSFRYSHESSVFPRFLTLLMCVFSLLLLFKNIRRLKESEGRNGSLSLSDAIRSLKIPAVVFGGTALYAVAINYIGYFTSTLLFMAGPMIAFGKQKVTTSIAITVIFMAVIYALFVSFLGLGLPKGLLL